MYLLLSLERASPSRVVDFLMRYSVIRYQPKGPALILYQEKQLDPQEAAEQSTSDNLEALRILSFCALAMILADNQGQPLMTSNSLP